MENKVTPKVASINPNWLTNHMEMTVEVRSMLESDRRIGPCGGRAAAFWLTAEVWTQAVSYKEAENVSSGF